MTFTLSFSHTQNGIRVPLIIDGQEITLQVESDKKISTYANPEVVKLCNEHQATVRRVS